jgi:hypothetical protein
MSFVKNVKCGMHGNDFFETSYLALIMADPLSRNNP